MGTFFPSTIVSNEIGPPRRVMERGREFLVVPAVLIHPGVLPGSKGPLRYTPEDISANVKQWDGVPLTCRHPFDPLTNEHLSASDPGVWERQGIGNIRETEFDGRLRAEAWVDVERANKIDKRIVNELDNGRPVELSTGLFTTQTPAPPNATLNGKPYVAFAREHVADHVAALPDERGACGIADGCGLLVNRGLVTNGWHPGRTGPDDCDTGWGGLRAASLAANARVPLDKRYSLEVTKHIDGTHRAEILDRKGASTAYKGAPQVVKTFKGKTAAAAEKAAREYHRDELGKFTANHEDDGECSCGGSCEQCKEKSEELIGGKVTGVQGQQRTVSQLAGNASSAALEAADFVRLPKGVSGTNCGNCEYQKDGNCTHPKLTPLKVTPRDCCAYWDAEGTQRPRTGLTGNKQQATANFLQRLDQLWVVNRRQVDNSNSEGHNQYTGAAGIHQAYQAAASLTDEQHASAHTAADAASKGELQEALGKMGFRAGAGDSRAKLAAKTKQMITARRGSALRVAITERAAPKMGGTKETVAKSAYGRELSRKEKALGDIRARLDKFSEGIRGLTGNDWSDAARAAALLARQASAAAHKASTHAGSPAGVGLGRRSFQGSAGRKALAAAKLAVDVGAAGLTASHPLGPDSYHRKAAVQHEAAAREHEGAADSAHKQGQVAVGMLHSQAAQAHKRAAGLHMSAAGQVSNKLQATLNFVGRLDQLYTVNCGGKGSGRPGPCPGGAHNAHVVARAHAAAAAHRLAEAARKHSRLGTAKTEAALHAAHDEYTAKMQASLQADAAKRTQGHLNPMPMRSASRVTKAPTVTGPQTAKGSLVKGKSSVTAANQPSQAEKEANALRADPNFVGSVVQQHLADHGWQDSRGNEVHQPLVQRAQAGKARPGDSALTQHIHDDVLEKLKDPDKATADWLDRKLPQMADAHAATAEGRGITKAHEFAAMVGKRSKKAATANFLHRLNTLHVVNRWNKARPQRRRAHA